MCSKRVPAALLLLKRPTSILGTINCFGTSASRERWRALCGPLTAATGTPRARSRPEEEDGLNYLVPLDSFDTRHLTITPKTERCDQTCCEAVKQEVETPPHTDSAAGQPGRTPQSTRLESVLSEEEVLCDLDDDWASTDVIAPADREDAWLRDRWQTGSPLRHQHTHKKKAFLTYNLHHLRLHGGLRPHGGDVEARGAAGAKQRGEKPDAGTQQRDGLETLPLRVDDRVKLIKQTATMELRSGWTCTPARPIYPLTHSPTHPPTHSLTRVYVLLLVWDMFPQSARRLAIPTDTAALDEGRGGWWCCWSVSLLLTTDSHHLPPDPHTAGRAVRYDRKLSNAQKAKNPPGTTPPTSGPETTSSAATEEWQPGSVWCQCIIWALR